MKVENEFDKKEGQTLQTLLKRSLYFHNSNLN